MTDEFAFRVANETITELHAEITRLREALAKQTERHEYPCSPHCAGYLREQAAQTEIERLRAALAEETECARQNDHVLARYEAALQGIVLRYDTDTDETDWPAEAMRDIARRALEPMP